MVEVDVELAEHLLDEKDDSEDGEATLTIQELPGNVFISYITRCL